MLLINCFSSQAQHTIFQPGDIFLGQGSGTIQWRDANGVLIRNIITGDGNANGNGTGLRIHPITGQLWVTNYNGGPAYTKGIRIINTDGTPGNTVNVSAYQGAPTSITFDNQGNAYVGDLWSPEIVKINAAGTSILDHYTVYTNNYVWGPEWVEMDCNDSTIYYANLRPRIKRYNVVTHQQLTDFADISPDPTWFFAMRRLPDSTMLVVSADNEILRLTAAGTIMQRYRPANLCGFFGMGGTADGKSFWAGGMAPNAPMYKFDISSGHVVDSFLASPVYPGINISGIAVYGDALRNCPAYAPVNNGNSITHLDVFPNPGNGAIKVRTDLKGTVTVIINNFFGQCMYRYTANFTGAVNTLPLNLTTLGAGIYLVQLISTEGRFVKKIVIR